MRYAFPGAGESFGQPVNRAASCTPAIRRETILNLPVKPRTVVPLDPNELGSIVLLEPSIRVSVKGTKRKR